MQTVRMLDVVYGPGAILCAGDIVTLPDSVAIPLITEGRARQIDSVSHGSPVIETAALTPGPLVETRRRKRQ